MTEAITPDYRSVAPTYDKGRPINAGDLDFVMNLISQAVGPKADGVRALDLGCGTGRFAIPMATRLGYKVIGADRSEDMLTGARSKPGADLVTWVREQATALSFADNSFDVFFMSHILHHIEKPLDVIREAQRVLRPGGAIINRYGAIEDIRDDPEHRFFPEVLELDLKRTPTKPQLEAWFREAGFVDVETVTVKQGYQTPSERLERVRVKMTSVLHLITEDAFENGLRRFEEYIRSHPRDEWVIRDLMTYTTGRLPE